MAKSWLTPSPLPTLTLLPQFRHTRDQERNSFYFWPRLPNPPCPPLSCNSIKMQKTEKKMQLQAIANGARNGVNSGGCLGVRLQRNKKRENRLGLPTSVCLWTLFDNIIVDIPMRSVATAEFQQNFRHFICQKANNFVKLFINNNRFVFQLLWPAGAGRRCLFFMFMRSRIPGLFG